MRDKQESEIDPELANLLSSTDTTLGKLREYFMNLDKKQLESQVNEAQAVIDAIQGGKASEQTSPETPEN